MAHRESHVGPAALEVGTVWWPEYWHGGAGVLYTVTPSVTKGHSERLEPRRDSIPQAERVDARCDPRLNCAS